MKTMKKSVLGVFVLAAALIFALAFTACGEGSEGPEGPEGPPADSLATSIPADCPILHNYPNDSAWVTDNWSESAGSRRVFKADGETFTAQTGGSDGATNSFYVYSYEEYKPEPGKTFYIIEALRSEGNVGKSYNIVTVSGNTMTWNGESFLKGN